MIAVMMMDRGINTVILKVVNDHGHGISDLLSAASEWMQEGDRLYRMNDRTFNVVSEDGEVTDILVWNVPDNLAPLIRENAIRHQAEFV